MPHLCLRAVFTAALCVGVIPAAPQSPNLFLPLTGAPSAAAVAWNTRAQTQDPTITASTYLRVDHQTLRAAGVGQSLTLSLSGKDHRFDITDVNFVLGYHVAIGVVPGRPGDVIFVLADNGLTYGTMHFGEESYVLVHAAHQDIHVLRTVDDRRRTLRCQTIPVMTRPTPFTPTALNSTDTLIDCAVFYTPRARSAAGSARGIESVIVGGVEQANAANRTSGVRAQFRLVYTGEVNYTENGSGSDLSRFRSRNDGHMDSVHALRNTYGADLMHLVTQPTSLQYCGIAYLMTNASTSFASNAFGVTVYSCISGNTMAHEFGHNIGCHHDRNNAGGAIYPHAYGFRTGDSRYRTVMSYSPGTRVDVWSSPSVKYQGYTMGVSGREDNALTIAKTKATVAQFRTAKAVEFCELDGEIAGWLGLAPKVKGWGTVNTAYSPKISFSSYRYFAQGFLVIGATPINLPYLGGILVPSPSVIAPMAGSQFPLVLDGSALSTLPSGANFYFQGFFLDPSAPQGMSASNGMKLILP